MAGAKAAPPPVELAASHTSLSRGLTTLLRGGNGDVETEPQPWPEVPLPLARRNRKLLQVSLCLTDLLLLLLATRLALKNGEAFGCLEVALCIVSLSTGAWLSCLAICLD